MPKVEEMNITVKMRIFLSLLLVAFGASFLFGYFLYTSQKEMFFSSMEDKLKSATEATKLYLGDNYVDTYTQTTPIGDEEHLKNVTKLSGYAKSIGLEYVYMMVKEQGKVLTVISSATDEELAKNEFDPFMTEYEASEGVQKSFESKQSFYEETIDKYGHFYSFIDVNSSSGGKTYVVGADVEMSYVSNELNSLLYKTLGLSVVVMVMATIFAYLISGSIAQKITQTQNGLLSFFGYLNKEIERVEPIKVTGSDEFDEMNKHINTNIQKIESSLRQDSDMVQDALEISKRVKSGNLNVHIQSTPANPQLVELQMVLNDMFAILYANIHSVLNELAVYAQNNFTKSVAKNNLEGDIAALIDGVNALGLEINGMLKTSLQSGLVLEHSSSVLQGSVENLSMSSNHQASSLEETAAAIEQLTHNISSSNQKTQKMSSVAKEAFSASSNGKSLADNTVLAMNEINKATLAINEAIATIDQIAFQTNILSLNAAVEAATAGDAGKGFAVVAGEVRNLANRSAEAAKQIKELAELANLKSNEGLDISKEMITGFEDINDKINQTMSLVEEVVVANSDQMNTIRQINSAVGELDHMTQKNAQNANETDTIAKEVSTLAKELVSQTSTKEFVGKQEVLAQSSYR